MSTATKTKPKTAVSATLESMRAKDNAPSGEAAEAVATATAVVEAEPFNWDELPAAEIAVYTRTAPAKDLEADTPAFIKVRVVGGFMATAKAGKPVWYVQDCGTPERAQEFLKLARRYATFKEYTLRGKENPHVPSEVRFTVKVREVRKAK